MIKIGEWSFDKKLVLENLREAVAELEERTKKLPVAIYVNGEFKEKVLEGLEDLHGIPIKVDSRLNLGCSLLVNEQLDRNIQNGVASFSFKRTSKSRGWIWTK